MSRNLHDRIDALHVCCRLFMWSIQLLIAFVTCLHVSSDSDFQVTCDVRLSQP